MKLPYYLLASALCLGMTISACSDGPTEVASEGGSSDVSSLNKKKDENGGENVDLCHATHYSDDDTNNGLFQDGDPAFVWISVDPRAVNKHKNQHGDDNREGSPADTVASSSTLCDRDDDVDGIPDDADNCVETPNNDQADGDDDTVGDVCDNCVNNENTDQSDVDSDNVGDVCDNCVNDANTDQANSDTDLLGDACDNCPNDDNNDQADADSDGVGDVCDNCVNDANADQANSDTDLLGDACDNCQYVDNNDQADADADGIGDACDVCVNDPFNDQDGDGLCDDGTDECPTENASDCDVEDEIFNDQTGCCEVDE